MTNTDQTYKKLRNEWFTLYNQYFFRPEVHDESSKIHVTFNYLLRNYLYEAQSKDFLPSVKYLEARCAKLWRKAEREKFSGIIDPIRVEQNKIKQTISESQFLPITTDHDESGEKLEFPYLKGRLIMSVGHLSQKEMEIIEYSLGASYDENFDALNLLAISVPVTRKITDKSELKISEYCKRVALAKIRDFIASNNLGAFDFEYSRKQKIKDYFTNRAI